MPVFLPGSEGSACTSDLVLPLYFLTGSESSLSVFLPGSENSAYLFRPGSENSAYSFLAWF